MSACILKSSFFVSVDVMVRGWDSFAAKDAEDLVVAA